MVLHDGRIRGGDGFFDYIGSYTCANGKWKGEIVNHEHTRARASGRCSAARSRIAFRYYTIPAEAEATALAGKRSIRSRRC